MSHSNGKAHGKPRDPVTPHHEQPLYWAGFLASIIASSIEEMRRGNPHLSLLTLQAGLSEWLACPVGDREQKREMRRKAGMS